MSIPWLIILPTALLTALLAALLALLLANLQSADVSAALLTPQVTGLQTPWSQAGLAMQPTWTTQGSSHGLSNPIQSIRQKATGLAAAAAKLTFRRAVVHRIVPAHTCSVSAANPQHGTQQLQMPGRHATGGGWAKKRNTPPVEGIVLRHCQHCFLLPLGVRRQAGQVLHCSTSHCGMITQLRTVDDPTSAPLLSPLKLHQYSTRHCAFPRHSHDCAFPAGPLHLLE